MTEKDKYLPPDIAARYDEFLTDERLVTAKTFHMSRAMVCSALHVTTKSLYRWHMTGRMPYLYDSFGNIYYNVEYLMEHIFSGRIGGNSAKRLIWIVDLIEFTYRLI